MKNACLALSVALTAMVGVYAQTQQQPTFRTGVNTVRVDVIVTDRQGTPIDNLTADDFEVTEDGKPQKVSSIKFLRVDTRTLPGEEAPREIRSLEEEASETSNEKNRLTVIFLDDYHVRFEVGIRLRQALRRFVQTQMTDHDLVALMYPLMPVSALRWTHDRFKLADDIDKFLGRRGEDPLEQQFGGNMEQVRNEVVLTAMRSLMVHLGGLREGRKSVIFASEGMALAYDRMHLLQEVFDEANKGNVSIYPLDPGGLGMGNQFMKDTLRSLADNTDGRALVNRNDLEDALQVVLRDSSAYYLVGYDTQPYTDGKFHEIRVRVKRPGLEVRARKGYYAPTADEAAKAAASAKPDAPPAVTSALATMARPASGKVISTWIGMSRADNGKTRVTFVWEPVRKPGSEQTSRPARVELTAYLGSQTLFDGAIERAPAGAARAAFDVPPGKIVLRTSVQSASGEVLEGDVRDVVVPDFRAVNAVIITTPAVFSGRTPRELRTALNDPNAAPTTSREFNRAERVIVKFEAYAPEGAPTLSVQLLNRNGQAISALQAQQLSASQYTLDLPLTGVPSGEYVIEIKAKGATGEASQMVGIKITG